MVDFKQLIAEELKKTIESLGLEEIENMIEIPPESHLGDYAFPCFKLAKTMKKAPNLIAQEIGETLGNLAFVHRVEPVNAYVNIFLSREALAKVAIEEIFEKKEAYGSDTIGAGKKVLVEFSSPNIAKPFHIGHIRTTVIGNAIYKIYDFLGYDTVRINHLGDYGTQFGKLIVAYKRWGVKEAIEANPISELLKIYMKFHEEAEKDPSLEDEARKAFKDLEDGNEEAKALWSWFREVSLKEFDMVYDLLGIEFDSFAGESFYSDKMDKVTDLMEAKGLLQPSQGAEIVDLEPYGLPPALIRKKDGSTLYITRDMAAAVYRKEHYNFYKNIYVVGAQQNLHFQQCFKMLELMGYDWYKDCVHVPFGLVSLEEGVMSTRKGRVVFLIDVLNNAVEKTKEIIREKNVNIDNIDEIAKQVGIGAIIFQELSNSRIKDYVFSWEKVLNFEGETGPYAQYTHARACGVLRKGNIKVDEHINYDYIKTDNAYELIKLLYSFEDVIKEAADKMEPAIIARHVINIAQSFNRYYHHEYILSDNEDEKKAKLALVSATAQTIRNGLALLNVHSPTQM